MVGEDHYFKANATAENYESKAGVANAALTIEHPVTITGLELGGRVMADSYNSQKTPDYLVCGRCRSSLSLGEHSVRVIPWLSKALNLEVGRGEYDRCRLNAR